MIPLVTELKLAHVLAALWFAGGQIAFILMHLRLHSSRSLVEQVFCLRFAGQCTKAAIVPGGLFSAFVGAMLAIIEGYNLIQTAWIVISIGLFLYATLMGLCYLTPSDRRALRVSEEELAKGLPPGRSRQLLARPRVVVLRMINLLAVLALIMLMIVKPSL
jgi:uncharacterized membrane protein